MQSQGWECRCSPHSKCCLISPSMLASDLANLSGEAKSVLAAGADELHLDALSKVGDETLDRGLGCK